MENVTTEMYNPHALITVRKIAEGESVYQLYKVTELEEVLNDASIRINQLASRLESQEKQLGQILDNMTADGWYNPNYEKSEVLSDLCDILGYEPKQTVRITGTISIELDYDIPLDEVEDFDAHYFLQDNLTVDCFNGDTVVESWNVEDHSVDWN
jgi:hypothetical protein